MLLCLSNLGSFMASSFQFAFGKLYCCLWCSSRHCCCNNTNYRRQRRRQHHEQQLKNLTQPGHVLSNNNKQPTTKSPQQQQQPEIIIINNKMKFNQDVITSSGITAEDLAQLAERDYDIVIDCCPDPASVVPAVAVGLNYCGSDRLNDKARILLADCSRYDDDKGSTPHLESWPASVEGQVIGDSPAPPAGQTDIKSMLGIVPASASADESTSKVNHGVSAAVPAAVVNKQQRVPVSVVLAFLVGYICIGAAVFSAWEEWSYLDGAYFSFITLSTIGFGDLVPGSKVLEQGETKLVACIVYLVVGLAMIAMSFNLVQEEVIYNFQRLGQNMGILDEK